MSEPLELELQAVVSIPMWVLRSERRSSERAGRTFNHSSGSAAPFYYFLNVLMDTHTGQGVDSTSRDGASGTAGMGV